MNFPGVPSHLSQLTSTNLAEETPSFSTSTTMEELLKVARRNDITVTTNFAQEGNLVAAKESFVHALRALKTLCQSGANCDQEIPSYRDLHMGFVTVQHSCLKEEDQTMFAQTVSVAQREVIPQHQEMVFFDKAILLQGTDVPCDTTATATVLLFNTGLLHHTEGLLTGRSDSFRRAVSFYKQSLTLLSQHQEQLSTSSTLLLVTCATSSVTPLAFGK